ncbi:amidase domain-containing protein [Geosporobacter ferrireducens]|uniref:Amidase domain-containing protein n=1 Tax=Geosporobacter ferrireducens TaxID=1424294 RepID=A0A1D8GK14_9FIRM|nr:amidase domain-containing protein [Geosporobacter ferrireducens]AOT71251.1 amidase domain-containing protein [Geosporobacter ferrireducens]
MYLSIFRKKPLRKLLLIITAMAVLTASVYYLNSLSQTVSVEVEEELADVIMQIFIRRSQAMLQKDQAALETLYDQETKLGVWALEFEKKKMKYLHDWAGKQGVRFVNIGSKTVLRSVKEKEFIYKCNLLVSTTYQYVYEDDPLTINTFRLGTYHSLDMIKTEEQQWLVRKEWYSDPFSNSLYLEQEKKENIREYILAQRPDPAPLLERRANAIAYADQHVGAAKESDFGYNKKYKNYNPYGGDCANYASQILHEGGKFRKTSTWNYEKGGSKAWVNAEAFKNYMLYSGRASLVANGTYEKVHKAAYKLQPGDFVAYEKGGKVVHISVITGADSKGYVLVNSHNTDRYRVPWDLGWSDKGIKFWLVHVHF